MACKVSGHLANQDTLLIRTHTHTSAGCGGVGGVMKIFGGKF